jgi:Glycosyl hydrolase family 76
MPASRLQSKLSSSIPAIFVMILCLSFSASKAQAQVSNSAYWTLAQTTHNFVVGNLLTSSAGYRIEPGSSTSYAWYDGSQMYADAAFIQAGDDRYTPYMNNTQTFMGNLWNTASPAGGYFAAVNVEGTGANGGQYVDDNSLIGVIYLDAYAVSTGTTQAQYLASAEACANWLINSGQWDDTYGGGFWWNTDKQVKPTQSNGLALQLFSRLYKMTGNTLYRTWANKVDTWLNAQMFDSSNGLYIWQIETGGVKQTVNFTYDNAIMIEADLDYADAFSKPAYVTKAEKLAKALNAVLWDDASGVYQFNTTDPRVNPTWCGWATQALLHLYQEDPKAVWLDHARRNIDFMNANLRNSETGGYYNFVNLDGTGVSTDIEGVDQAWMERTQVLLAAYD